MSKNVMNKLDAWLEKKNPWLTVENPNPNERNKKFIKVRANEYWGNPEPKREKNRGPA